MTKVGFTLWIRGTEERTLKAAEALQSLLVRHDWPVEVINLVPIARKIYEQKTGSISSTISLAVNSLNRHGIVVLLCGAQKASKDMNWGEDKPVRMDDLICSPASEGDEILFEMRPWLMVEDSLPDNNISPSGVIEALERRGWLEGKADSPNEEVSSAEDEEEIRKRLEKLGYL